MAHELIKLSSSLYNQPLLISKEELNVIEEYLTLRNSGALLELDYTKKPLAREELRVENGIGVISVQGSITSKANILFESLCGMVSYETLLREVNALCKMSDVHTILMDVDSGGGEARNMVSTSREIRKIVNESGKKLIGFCNGMAASAAYGLISACDEIIMTSDSSVGSIGVLLALRNTNKADEQAGISTTYVTAGASKIPFDKDTMEFREDYISDLQEKVDLLYEKFTGLIAEQRNIDLSLVKNTEAKVFSADKALELGLVDKVLDPTEFYEYLASLSESGEQTNSPQQTGSSPTKIAAKSNVAETQLINIGDEEMTPEQQAKLEQFDAMQAKLAALEAAQTQAKANEIKESLSAYSFLSEDVQASLSEVLLAEGEHASLFSTVLTQANDGIKAAVDAVKAESQEAIETLSTEVDKAKAEVESTKTEMNAIKEQFGAQDSIQGEVDKQELSAPMDETSKLAAKVAKKLQQNK